jgi:hypothetical protein
MTAFLDHFRSVWQKSFLEGAYCSDDESEMLRDCEILIQNMIESLPNHIYEVYSREKSKI